MTGYLTRIINVSLQIITHWKFKVQFSGYITCLSQAVLMEWLITVMLYVLNAHREISIFLLGQRGLIYMVQWRVALWQKITFTSPYNNIITKITFINFVIIQHEMKGIVVQMVLSLHSLSFNRICHHLGVPGSNVVTLSTTDRSVFLRYTLFQPNK